MLMILGMLLVLALTIGGLYFQLALIRRDDDGLASLRATLWHPFYLLSLIFSPMLDENETGEEVVDQLKKTKKRVIIPLAVGHIFLFAMIVYTLISILFDENSKYDYEVLFENILRIYVLIYTTTIKAYLGPFVCAITLAIFAYFFFEYGDIRFHNILRPFLDWVFVNFSKSVKSAYAVILVVIVVGGTIIDSFDTDWFENIFS